MAEQNKSTWRVLERVHVSELEGKLNELSALGYQIFRIAPKGDHAEAFVVVAFDPVKMADAQGKAMLQAVDGLKSLLDGALPKSG